LESIGGKIDVPKIDTIAPFRLLFHAFSFSFLFGSEYLGDWGAGW
jgi:hypothetical protein